MQEYERLRTHVLSGSPLTRPAGLVVLLRQGLAVWSARRTACSLSPSAVPRSTTPVATAKGHAALVPVLVNMVLGAQQAVQI